MRNANCTDCVDLKPSQWVIDFFSADKKTLTPLLAEKSTGLSKTRDTITVQSTHFMVSVVRNSAPDTLERIRNELVSRVDKFYCPSVFHLGREIVAEITRCV